MKLFAILLLLGSSGRPRSARHRIWVKRRHWRKFQELDRRRRAPSSAGNYAAAAQQYGEAACLVPKSARAFYGWASPKPPREIPGRAQGA